MARTNYIMIPTKGNSKVYCKAYNRIVNIDWLMERGKCLGCPYYVGSAQGDGVECFFDAGEKGKTYSVEYEPMEFVERVGITLEESNVIQ